MNRLSDSLDRLLLVPPSAASLYSGGSTVLLWLMAVVVGGCDGLFEERLVEHPIADSLAAPPEEALVVRRTGRAAVTEAAARLEVYRERLSRRQVMATIGELDGAPEYTFGRVVDAVVTETGDVMVVDRQASTIGVYDSVGTYLYTLGGQGEGPGEFQFPVAVLLAGPDRLLVVDEAQLVHRFERKTKWFQYKDRSKIGAFAFDACLNVDGFVVHALSIRELEALYRFGFDGVLQARFAVPYRHSAWLVRNAVSRGQIACFKENHLAILAFQKRDVVEAYSTEDGHLAWHARLEGLHPSQVLESEGGRRVTTGVMNNPSIHGLAQLAGGSGAPVFAQYIFALSEDIIGRTGRSRLETYVLDPETGTGEFWGDSIPEMLQATEHHVVFLHREPFPRVEVTTLP